MEHRPEPTDRPADEAADAPAGDRFSPPGFHDPGGETPWFDIGGDA